MHAPPFVRIQVLSLPNPMTALLANEMPCHPCIGGHIGIIALMWSAALSGDELLPLDKAGLPDGIEHQFE